MGCEQRGYVPTGVVQWEVLEVQQPCNDQKTRLADIMQQPKLPGRALPPMQYGNFKLPLIT